jgi:hypothetical protein
LFEGKSAKQSVKLESAPHRINPTAPRLAPHRASRSGKLPIATGENLAAGAAAFIGHWRHFGARIDRKDAQSGLIREPGLLAPAWLVQAPRGADRRRPWPSCHAEGRGFESHQPLGFLEPFPPFAWSRGRGPKSPAGARWCPCTAPRWLVLVSKLASRDTA